MNTPHPGPFALQLKREENFHVYHLFMGQLLGPSVVACIIVNKGGHADAVLMKQPEILNSLSSPNKNYFNVYVHASIKFK